MLSETVNIRPASQDELRRLACFFHITLLRDANYQVTVKGSLNRIVGFICVVPPADPGTTAIFQWRVVSRYSGSELEREMVGNAIDQSLEYGAAVLESSDMLKAGSTADRLLDSLGFEVVLTDDVYEIELASGKTRVNHSQERLADRRPAPADACVLSLDDHTWPAAAGLAIRHGLLAQRFANLGFSETPFAAGSAVLLVRGMVMGVILGTVHGRIAEVAAMVVHEELRSGTHWANTFLTYVYGRWMTSLGVEMLRFRAHPTRSREIRNFARRCGGWIVARQHARALKLSGDEPAVAA